MPDLIEFTIAQHFLPALINADPTGLTDEEERALDAFERDAFASLPPHAWAHWSVSVADCRNYARCEITKLLSEVSDIALVFQPLPTE